MKSIRDLLQLFQFKHIKTKIIVLFFSIAIISGVISLYSFYQLDILNDNVDVMGEDLNAINTGINVISTLGLNISDVHSRIGILINQMPQDILSYKEGDIQGKTLFFQHQENFTTLIQKVDDEIGDQYGSLKVDIAHIQTNFNQYIFTVENSNIFDKIDALNDLEDQLNDYLDQINGSTINQISSLHSQINDKNQEISLIFQSLSNYESKIEKQLDSLINNLYFEINMINMNAQQSNEDALQKKQSIQLDISTYKMQLIGSSFFLIIFACLIGVVYSSKITNALNRLTTASKKMKKGSFPDKPIEVNSQDEFRLLTDTFNSMMINLKDYNENLEKEISQRTHDLTEKVEELEQWKELTVGRELKMKELKKKIKTMEKTQENSKQ